MENEPLPPRPERGHPAHGVHVQPDSPTIVFLTVCLQERRSLLAVPAVRQCLHQLWLERATAWLVSDYLLMPDHLHLFCHPGVPVATLERWMAFWKDQSAKELGWAKGTWQRDGFHHRLRSRTEYEEKWQYVRHNPMRAGLVQVPEQWPHQGRVHEIPVVW